METFKLRDYQIALAKKGLELLKKHGVCYYAVQVRCGKTLTALEVCKLYGAEKVLFLTKKKAIAGIEADYKNFEYTFDLKVTNYEQLGKFQFDFDMVICDESHCLGAYPKPSLRAKWLKSYVKNNPVIYLSGTPTPEGYSQIYHQLWVNNNSPYRQYKNFYTWARDYVDVFQERRGIYMVNNYSRAKEERIKRDIAPIMLTYTQEAAGFNCPVTEHLLEVVDEQLPVLIRRLFKERILPFPAGACVAETPAALMQKMHQLSGGSVICEDVINNLPVRKAQIISDSKAKFIKEYFQGKRIAIYYKFIAEKTIIKSQFPDATESPEEFLEGKSNTFISQVLSGREGITLRTADAIVFYSIDYSATSYFQARARLQDLRRDTPAEVYWIFLKGGIEKKVYQAVSAKIDFTYSYFRKHVIL